VSRLEAAAGSLDGGEIFEVRWTPEDGRNDNYLIYIQEIGIMMPPRSIQVGKASSWLIDRST